MNDIKTVAVKKISPADTLKSIKVGDTVIIKDKHVKSNVPDPLYQGCQKRDTLFIQRAVLKV